MSIKSIMRRWQWQLLCPLCLFMHGNVVCIPVIDNCIYNASLNLNTAFNEQILGIAMGEKVPLTNVTLIHGLATKNTNKRQQQKHQTNCGKICNSNLAY